MALKSTSVLEKYSVRNNTIDLTTTEINDSNKGYLVDKRLIDLFVSQLISIPFEEAKEAICGMLATTKSFSEMEEVFNNCIYEHKICAMYKQSENPTSVKPEDTFG